MKWLLIFCSFFIFFISAFSSCDLSMFANNRSRQYSIVSPEDDISQIPSEDFFYINLKSAYYTGGKGSFDPLDFLLYAMDDGPGTQCKISFNEKSATEDLYCMLEVAEGDLWYHEINLEYNVPPGMCSYLAFMPHWHYNQPTGKGPDDVYECKFQTGTNDAGEPITEKRYSTKQPGEYCNNPFKKEKEDLCPYNKSSEEKSGLANCCYGTYQLIGEEANSGEWGGDIKQCIGGLARLNWDTFDTNGFPGVLIVQTGSKGLNEGYTLKPLIDGIESSQRFSFPTANFFSGMEDKEWEAGSEPPFYRENAEAKGYFTDAPFITWACLDQNKEVRHTIKLIIQEWNTQEEFIKFKESNGTRGDPDTGDNEGSGCDYYENNTLQFGKCDDLDDADKFKSDHSNNECKDICNKNKGDCDEGCEECDNRCGGDKRRCDTGCTNTEAECNTACTGNKSTCDRGCESNCYQGIRETCAGQKQSANGVCQITKEYDDVCCEVDSCRTALPGSPDEAKCITDSTDKFNTCQDDADDDENECLNTNMPLPGQCISECKQVCTNTEAECNTACTGNKSTCDRGCEETETECDRGCEGNRSTCKTACTETKSTCDKNCDDYPLIKYK